MYTYTHRFTNLESLNESKDGRLSRCYQVEAGLRAEYATLQVSV